MPFKVLRHDLDASKFSPDMFPEDSTVVVDDPYYQEDGRKLVLLMFEPECIAPFTQATLDNGHRFYRIYTYNAEVLKAFPETAVKVVGNYTRMTPDEIASTDISKKEFKISFWVSSKWGWPLAHGHKLRQTLHLNQHNFPPNCIFYRSEIPFSGYLCPDINNNPSFNYDNKANLFTTFQYSVTIQNAREENFFTDHLIDCLIMKTIPIYWGCPNVSEFFDTTGWIIFEDERDLLNKISYLDENHYAKHLDIVEKNFKEALKYADFYKNFERQALK